MTHVDDLIGQTFGNSVLLDVIGQGGMAKVYHAHQAHLDRDVAVKLLPPDYGDDRTFVERFEIEARAMARLRHPHIITIHDAGRQGDWLYIVMEYVPGGTLRQRMQQPMRISEAARIFHDIAYALQYAHERGIIHQDIKPANILLDPSNHLYPWPRAVLTDFGIARIMEQSHVAPRLATGIGTPEYMSPEQCRGINVDHRTDIYALGIVLYEVLCGRPPFTGSEFTAIAHAHLTEQVPSASAINSHVSPAIQQVIQQALAKDPTDRFQSARALADALDQAVAAFPTRTPSRQLVQICPNCQSENPVTRNFCTRCGASLKMNAQLPPLPLQSLVDMPTVTCLACGAINGGANRFCTSCGRRLSTVVCQYCGRVTPSGDAPCLHCGRSPHLHITPTARG